MRKKIKKRHEINIYLTIINDNWQFNMLASKIQILKETFCIFCCRNNSNKAKIQNKKHIPQKKQQQQQSEQQLRLHSIRNILLVNKWESKSFIRFSKWFMGPRLLRYTTSPFLFSHPLPPPSPSFLSLLHKYNTIQCTKLDESLG